MNKDPRFGLNEGEYYLDEDGDYMDEFCLKVSSTDTDCSIYHDGKWKDSKLPWDKSVYDFVQLVDLSYQKEFNLGTWNMYEEEYWRDWQYQIQKGEKEEDLDRIYGIQIYSK